MNDWQGLQFNNYHRNNNWAVSIETNFIYAYNNVRLESEQESTYY